MGEWWAAMPGRGTCAWCVVRGGSLRKIGRMENGINAFTAQRNYLGLTSGEGGRDAAKAREKAYMRFESLSSQAMDGDGWGLRPSRG